MLCFDPSDICACTVVAGGYPSPFGVVDHSPEVGSGQSAQVRIRAANVSIRRLWSRTSFRSTKCIGLFTLLPVSNGAPRSTRSSFLSSRRGCNTVNSTVSRGPSCWQTDLKPSSWIDGVVLDAWPGEASFPQPKCEYTYSRFLTPGQ